MICFREFNGLNERKNELRFNEVERNKSRTRANTGREGNLPEFPIVRACEGDDADANEDEDANDDDVHEDADATNVRAVQSVCSKQARNAEVGAPDSYTPMNCLQMRGFLSTTQDWRSQTTFAMPTHVSNVPSWSAKTNKKKVKMTHRGQYGAQRQPQCISMLTPMRGLFSLVGMWKGVRVDGMAVNRKRRRRRSCLDLRGLFPSLKSTFIQ